MKIPRSRGESRKCHRMRDASRRKCRPDDPVLPLTRATMRVRAMTSPARASRVVLFPTVGSSAALAGPRGCDRRRGLALAHCREDVRAAYDHRAAQRTCKGHRDCKGESQHQSRELEISMVEHRASWFGVLLE